MKHVYLLGAGFTRAVIGEKALLGDEIMEALDISEYPEIFDLFEESSGIEEFFTKVDLRYIVFRGKNRSLEERYEKIRNEIKVQVTDLFSVKNIDIENFNSTVQIGDKFVESVPDDSTFITLNYDCVLDQLLWRARVWEPFRGYSYPTTSTAFSDTEEEYKEMLEKIEDKLYEKVKKKNILLLKIHGSENFKFYKNNDFVDVVVSGEIFKDINPELSIQEDENKGSNVLLLSYLKEINTDLFRAWQKAISELEKADVLTIIGCSLRDEDKMLRFVLSYFGRKLEAKDISEESDRFQEKKVIIVDKSKDAIDKIKKMIQSERLFLYPFRDESRIKTFLRMDKFLLDPR